jgi:polar amino acid transport system substrate-binding protein
MGMFKFRLSLLVIMSVAINHIWAEDTFIIVTDPWPPYVYVEDNRTVGIDADIALAVLDKMGIKGRIEMQPWKRSLTSVKNLQADAILSAAVTTDRKEFLYFPAEPVSKGVTVFFQRKQRNITSKSLGDLKELKVGAMLGYKYCAELDESPLLLSASRVATLEQSFNMLMNDRIDVLVEVDAVGMYKAKEMGLSDEISMLKGPSYCSVGNHLAFAKKPGAKVLAKKFGIELIKFKTTDEYKNILKKYGMEVYSS